MAKNTYTHRINIYQYDITEDYQRRKRYVKKEVTDSVQQPITLFDRKDTALDTSGIQILNKSKKALLPMTRFMVTSSYYDEEETLVAKFHYFYVVDVDNVSQVVYSSIPSKRVYMHEISLVENTKWLERFDVDNTTITNMLMFLYGNNGIVSEPTTANKYITEVSGTTATIYNPQDQYADNQRFYASESNLGHTINCSARYNVWATSTYMFGIIPINKDFNGTLARFWVTTPNGVDVDLSDNQQTYTPDVSTYGYGVYTFHQSYDIYGFGDSHMNIRYDWQVNLIEFETITEKLPQRYSIADVMDKVLSQVTRENSIRLVTDAPLFQLDPNQRDLLRNMIAPEFTFTQNTLFGILCEIGSAIHAMPRLLVQDPDGDNPDWSVIHFDFFENTSDKTTYADSIKVAYATQQSGENYTTAFVTNIQNAFISTETEYITIEEPFDTGYISTRTEEGTYEISNDHAVIKTSRPIQRITELWCKVDGQDPLDIASYCKEKADYDLLTDYMFSNPGAGFGLGTKQTNIYFTRGDSVIRGLDYLAPNSVGLTPSIGKKRSIQYILIWCAVANGMSQADAVTAFGNVNLADISFRIKYVPYLSFKAKQFREVIRDEMETSTLYFNQSGQQVDITAFGENIKGALNMTSNEEPTLTIVSKTPIFVDINGLATAYFEKAFDNYMPYEIKREISKKCTITTIRYSKDFNKWNEYIAIKKNYRQYEISERECLEQNPVYNQFVLIDDEADYDVLPDLDPEDPAYNDVKEELQNYATSLNAKEGFMKNAGKLMRSFSGLYGVDGYNNIPKWCIVVTSGQEWNSSTREYDDVTNRFLVPVASFNMGNSAVMNIATVDNYSAGTTTSRPDETGLEPGSLLSIGYRLERAIQYGTKYGTFSQMQISMGNGEIDSHIGAGTKTQTQRAQELYVVPEYVGDGDRTAITNIVAKIWSNPFAINKDSRQKISLTLQLNSVSEKDYIWLGKLFVSRFGLSNNPATNNRLKLRYFKETPDRFLSKIPTMYAPRTDSVVSISRTNITKYGLNLQTPTFKTDFQSTTNFEATDDYVGYGLIDNNNNVILYYNQPVKNGEKPKDIYFMFRDRI